MKSAQLLQIVVLSIVTLGLSSRAHAQEYNLSTPISGVISMSVRDLNGPPDSHFDGRGSTGASDGFWWNFSTLTEHIYVDQSAGTIRQVGTISGTPAAQNIVFNDQQGAVSGALTVYAAPSGGGVITFDTGPQQMTQTGPNIYTFNGDVLSLGSFNGSYSLVTGGQTYTGSYSYNTAAWGGLAARTFTQFTQTSPNSIALSGLSDVNMGIVGGVRYGASPAIVEDVTAANGFHLQLSPGAGEGFGVFGDVLNWSSGTVTASLVPEPCCLMFFACGLAGIAFLRRRQA